MSDVQDRGELQRLAPPRTPSHPSPRALEGLAFDAPEAHQGSDLASHVAGCARCAAEVEELRAGRVGFLTARPAAAFMAKLDATQTPTLLERLMAWLRPGPLLAVVMAGLLLVVVVRMTPEPERGVKLRGAATLALHVSRGGAPAAPFDGRPLAAGDVLRFVVDAEADGYALVANLDDQGRVTVYVPPTEAGRVPVVAGRDRVLPGSIALDDFVGTERVFLFMSAAPLGHAEVEAALRAAFEKAQGRLQDVDAVDLPAAISSVTVVKAGGDEAR